MKNEIINFLHTHWAEISVLVYEIIARLLPTSKNLSLLDLLLKLTGKTLELTQKGVDKVVPNNQKNTIKSFLVFALLSLALSANAQLNINAKTLRLTDNIAAKDTLANAVDGQLYYNHTTDALRLRSAGAWTTLGTGGGGLSTASNGLNVSGSDVRMGGALTANTTVSGAFNLDFTMNAHRINSGVLQIFNPARTFSYRIDGAAIIANRVITIPLIGGDRFLMLATAGVSNGIPYQTGVSGEYNVLAGFTFNGTTFTTPNVVSTGRGTFTTTATLPGINVGSFAGDPSTRVVGDVWYNSSSGTTKFTSSNLELGNGLADAARTIRSNGLTSVSSLVLESFGSSSSITLQNSTGTSFTSTIKPSSGNGIDFSLSSSTHTILGGNQSSTFNISARPSVTTAVAGTNLSLNSGVATTGNANGGNVIINPGAGIGTGLNGKIQIASGTNKPMGIATLVGGTVTVNNHLVTASSRIFLTSNVDGGTPGFVRVSARVNGTSFTITSSSGTDTSQIAWLILEN